MHLDPVTHQLTAIVLAGDRTKADSLINHTSAGSKAMIDLEGKPMVRHVLNSLREARVVNKICLAGPEASEVATDEKLQQWVDEGEIHIHDADEIAKHTPEQQAVLIKTKKIEMPKKEQLKPSSGDVRETMRKEAREALGEALFGKIRTACGRR